MRARQLASLPLLHRRLSRPACLDESGQRGRRRDDRVAGWSSIHPVDEALRLPEAPEVVAVDGNAVNDCQAARIAGLIRDRRRMPGGGSCPRVEALTLALGDERASRLADDAIAAAFDHAA